MATGWTIVAAAAVASLSSPLAACNCTLGMCQAACNASASTGAGCLHCEATVCTETVLNDTWPPATEWGPNTQARGGHRVVQTAEGWEHTKVWHTLYLPSEYEPSRKSTAKTARYATHLLCTPLADCTYYHQHASEETRSDTCGRVRSAFMTLLCSGNSGVDDGGGKAAHKWPLLVEYSGNYCGPGGPVELNDCGSEWTAQGWGIGLGTRYIWLTLPFLTADLGNATANSVYWWGCNSTGCPTCDPPTDCYNLGPNKNESYTTSTTVAYAKAAIKQVAEQYGVDMTKIVLIGHSRGAIAVQAIGGADDEMASMWAGVVAASHYDDIGSESWPYASSQAAGTHGKADAIVRAKRMASIPKFLVGECDLESGVAAGWLQETTNGAGVVAALSTGFRDHTGFWILRPSPTGAREKIRSWVANITG